MFFSPQFSSPVARWIGSTIDLFERFSFSSNTATKKSIFYIPPHLDLSTLPATSLVKIRSLRETDQRVAIGISAVRRVSDDSLAPVFFRVFRDHVNEQLSTIKAYDLDTNQEIGAALIGEEKYIENAYVLVGPPVELTHYREDSESYKGRFIYLSHVENKQRETFKNVGAVLFKAVLQYYQDTYDYHLKLESVRENAPLYYKLGCVVSEKKDQPLQVGIEKAAKSKEKSTRNWGPVYMAMSEAGREHWKREIEKRPIRFPDDV